jgi:hypothetical protein
MERYALGSAWTSGKPTRESADQAPYSGHLAVTILLAENISFPLAPAIIIAGYKGPIGSEDFKNQIHRWRAMPKEALPPRP